MNYSLTQRNWNFEFRSRKNTLERLLLNNTNLGENELKIHRNFKISLIRFFHIFQKTKGENNFFVPKNYDKNAYYFLYLANLKIEFKSSIRKMKKVLFNNSTSFGKQQKNLDKNMLYITQFIDSLIIPKY